MNTAKLLYFTVFTLVAFAFVFHVTGMGFHHWKEAHRKNVSRTVTIGLFTRCFESNITRAQSCEPNLFPERRCVPYGCSQRPVNETCECDYSPSTKGIAACTIIAAIFLGIVVILLFIQSITDNMESTILGVIFGFLPLALLFLVFSFILTALILVGSYLSRDMMLLERRGNLIEEELDVLRDRVSQLYDIRIGWSTGLEIIALVLTFLSFLLYNVFVFRVGR